MDMSAANMIAQVESLPELIRSEFDELDARVRRLLNHNEYLSVKRIVLTGCGDSHMASVASELAFEQVAGVPTDGADSDAGRALCRAVLRAYVCAQPAGRGHLRLRNGCAHA